MSARTGLRHGARREGNDEAATAREKIAHGQHARQGTQCRDSDGGAGARNGTGPALARLSWLGQAWTGP